MVYTDYSIFDFEIKCKEMDIFGKKRKNLNPWDKIIARMDRNSLPGVILLVSCLVGGGALQLVASHGVLLGVD